MPLEPAIDKPRIVIADDDTIQRLLLSETLSGSRVLPAFVILEATDGAQAVELIRAQRPALAMIDVHMPRLTGTEVCRLLKADVELHQIPLILMSAGEHEHDARDAGCDDFIGKPYEEKLLEQKIYRLLSMSR